MQPKERLEPRRVGGWVTLAALVVLPQLVPYGRDHRNPPITGTPTWDSPRTAELARRACFDCHSHETRWPWYSSLAPLSWLSLNTASWRCALVPRSTILPKSIKMISSS